jgi:hypothetical protein
MRFNGNEAFIVLRGIDFFDTAVPEEIGAGGGIGAGYVKLSKVNRLWRFLGRCG